MVKSPGLAILISGLQLLRMIEWWGEIFTVLQKESYLLTLGNVMMLVVDLAIKLALPYDVYRIYPM